MNTLPSKSLVKPKLQTITIEQATGTMINELCSFIININASHIFSPPGTLKGYAYEILNIYITPNNYFLCKDTVE